MQVQNNNSFFFILSDLHVQLHDVPLVVAYSYSDVHVHI